MIIDGPSPPKPASTPPPTLWSKAWLHNRLAAWWKQPRTLKWIQVLALLFTSIVFLQSLWKFAWGQIYYSIEYIKSSFGYDVLDQPCARIMKEVYPWRDLEWEEYWRWNRCVGNEAGWRRQGQLVPTLEGASMWLLNPFVFASWVRIAFIISFFLYLWGPIKQKAICFLHFLPGRSHAIYLDEPFLDPLHDFFHNNIGYFQYGACRSPTTLSISGVKQWTGKSKNSSFTIPIQHIYGTIDRRPIINEVYRLYNRALVSAVKIRDLSPEEVPSSGEKV